MEEWGSALATTRTMIDAAEGMLNLARHLSQCQYLSDLDKSRKDDNQ
jgi:hypothetical protein